MKRAFLLAVLSMACSSSGSSSNPVVGCGAVNAVGAGTSCSIKLDKCTDGHVYLLDCTNSTSAPYDCDCKVDGTGNGKSIKTSTLCTSSGKGDYPAIDAACGCNLQ
jgi:hypothetical protein